MHINCLTYAWDQVYERPTENATWTTWAACLSWDNTLHWIIHPAGGHVWMERIGLQTKRIQITAQLTNIPSSNGIRTVTTGNGFGAVQMEPHMHWFGCH